MRDDPFIPFHRPSISREESEEVARVLASGWLTTGQVAQQFECEFAKYVGCKHAVAVNSATAALQLALDAIGLCPHDEVLVPTNTFTATAEVVTYFGARPILCDSVKDGFNIDPEDASRRITPKTRAIIPVHIAGEPCDLNAVHSVAARHQLHVIEDAAHALPAIYRGKRIGALSELTAFSFYATKPITTGEGGMLTTDSDPLARRARMMRLHGISTDAWNRYAKEGSWFYEVQEAGYKLNLPDLLAAIGVAQLRKCDDFHERRKAIAKQYTNAFCHSNELEVPPDGAPGEHAWHLYVLRLVPESLKIDRSAFIDALMAMGIGCSVHFIPLHLHPYYQRIYGYKEGDFPNAEDVYRRSISLPIYPDMTDVEIDRVIRAVKRVIERAAIPKAVAA
jgi:dTDP-4-amino-4,6-dideoxygalactose transaminase